MPVTLATGTWLPSPWSSSDATGPMVVPLYVRVVRVPFVPPHVDVAAQHERLRPCDQFSASGVTTDGVPAVVPSMLRLRS